MASAPFGSDLGNPFGEPVDEYQTYLLAGQGQSWICNRCGAQTDKPRGPVSEEKRLKEYAGPFRRFGRLDGRSLK